LAKKKLQQFAENVTFPNLLQPEYHEVADKYPLRGKWNPDFFHSEKPLFLELGCGKGEYTVELAKRNPENNYLGIDRKGARLWRGAKTAVEENLVNAGFIRTSADFVSNIFGRNEIDGIWITFPDPQPQKSREKKRLTSPRYLKMYKKILKPGGIVHLKTDDHGLFHYSLNVIQESGFVAYATENLYNSGYTGYATQVQTFYEKMHLSEGKNIFYMQFALSRKGNNRKEDIQDHNFFGRVYEVVKLIPFGKVTTYGAIAAYLGSKGSSRMVGWAMNASHHSFDSIPAHRVVNRNGQLTGKHHFGGHDIMSQPLQSEGIAIEEDKVKAFGRIFWDPAKEIL
jgi:tRNA (guanine-N7-)-methyltransferase